MRESVGGLGAHIDSLADLLRPDRADVVSTLYALAADAFELGQLTREDDIADGTTTSNPFRRATADVTPSGRPIMEPLDSVETWNRGGDNGR